ncbi:hypothetical protein ElyMa_003786300, partial [Elysia marginata]
MPCRINRSQAGPARNSRDDHRNEDCSARFLLQWTACSEEANFTCELRASPLKDFHLEH